MMRNLKFNMIEIVLAIGIAAFGVTAVVAMIPPALNANRDVSADAFVDEAVSKIGAYINLVLMYKDKDEWNAKCPTTRSTTTITSNPGGNDVILGFNMKHSSNGVYWMEASDGTQFVVTLWRDPSTISDFYVSDGSTSSSKSLSDGVRIHAEIAWPANRSTNRETRTFCWDAFYQ